MILSRRALLTLALFACACSREPEGPRPAAGPRLDWAEVIDREPDPEVIRDPELRARIEATGLAWRVLHVESGIELLLVPPGEFRRGATEDDDQAFADERPAHRVLVEEAFYLGRFEVTQEQWQRVMDENPSHFRGVPRRPVEQVTRFDVQEFLGSTGFDLATESQWEYACRAGDRHPLYGALDEIAWHRSNAEHHAHPVGEKLPNALGLHDMLGNVWEWTTSWYIADEYTRCTEGVNATDEPRLGSVLVLRGGSWYDNAARLRASARYAGAWSFSAGHVGFRVAKRLDFAR